MSETVRQTDTLSNPGVPARRHPLALRLLERAVVFAFGWWVLSEGYTSSWTFGVPFVVFASIASVQLTPKRGWRYRPLGFLRYLGFFFSHSIMAGIDVARRALSPSMRLDPEFVTYPFRIAEDAGRVMLADTVSLLPGTLSSGIEGDTLVLHVLDCSPDIVAETRRVEERIADALGIELVEPAGGGAGV